jgi:hypothetical protein
MLDKGKWKHCNLVDIVFYLILQNLIYLTHFFQSIQPTVMHMHVSRQTTRVYVVSWLADWNCVPEGQPRPVICFYSPDNMLVPNNVHRDKTSCHHTSQHYQAFCIVYALRLQLHTADTSIKLFGIYKCFL